MAYGNYPTPSQTGIYVGEFHVDDAYSVEWKYRDNRTPMYSYFDQEVVNVAHGKKIVVGSIAINFRYPGYLPFAIKEARQKKYDADQIRNIQQEGHSYFDQYLDEMRTGDANERMRLLLQAAAIGPKALEKMSALAYISSLSGTPVEGAIGRQIEFQDVFDVQDEGNGGIIPVDIRTHFGDIDEVHVAEIIEDVVFVGESQQIQAGATAAGGLSASGSNILQVYSFWARKVTKVRIDPTQIRSGNV